MAALRVLETQCQKFIKSRISLDDEDESSGTKSKEHDTSNISGNDAHIDDADIKHIYGEEPMADVQLSADNNVFATRQQHTEQPEFNNEGEVDQNAEQCHDTCPLPAKLTDNQTIELSNQSLEYENTYLKKTVAQFQKDFSKLETHCINLELQLQNKALKSRQQCKFLKAKGNEANVKHDIDTTGNEANVGLSACTSINVQEKQNLDLSAGTPSNLEKERTKACIKENVISGRPMLDVC
ncbi:hypothetical protein Tco_0727691 [Tanacetum coccineum]|uniref:Uncharacterized protein n=1 Tax=Tanacetum coccineum TaxID=301880 RepID=A0ABQ4YJZ6_9ASTR